MGGTISTAMAKNGDDMMARQRESKPSLPFPSSPLSLSPHLSISFRLLPPDYILLTLSMVLTLTSLQ
jgi:hypothetical protein